MPDKYHEGSRAYDLIQAIEDNYSKAQQAKIFAAGHVHNKKHVADVSGYDGYTGVMAKFLSLNMPSTASGGTRNYPDFHPFLNRGGSGLGQSPAFIISAYGVTVYGTGTNYGGIDNIPQNIVMPNEYKSYFLYKQLKR